MAEIHSNHSSSEIDIARLVLNKLGEIETFHSRALPILPIPEQFEGSLVDVKVEDTFHDTVLAKNAAECEGCKKMRESERREEELEELTVKRRDGGGGGGCCGCDELRVRKGRSNGVRVGGKLLRGLSKVIEAKLKEGWGVLGSKGDKEIIACRKVMISKEEDEGDCGDTRFKEEEERSEGLRVIVPFKKRMKLRESVGDLEVKVEELRENKEQGECLKEIEIKERELCNRCQEVGAREKRISKRRKDLDLREQRLNERYQSQVYNQIEIDEKWNELELRLKQIRERTIALDVLEKEIDKRCESLKFQEREKNSSGEQILKLCRGMSGKTLQTFMNERFMEHHSLTNTLCNGLKLSNDPGKLVLSAIHGFFPPHLEGSGGLLFDTEAVRTSCLLMLEYLMNMKVVISENVKNEAIKVASEWREGMVAEGMTSVVILGFLLLLAAFNLGSNYETKELQGLFDLIKDHRLAPQIGLTLALSTTQNDAHSDSKTGNKCNATAIEAPGIEKQAIVASDQMCIPYNQTCAMYEPSVYGVPIQYQYPVWPQGIPATPAACNCVHPFCCSWCRPLPYYYPPFP